MIKTVSDASIKDRKVFIRCDFDVTLSGSKITDDTRLITSISTIEYLLENDAEVIAAGHLGRPKGVDEKLSALPVVEWFAKQFGSEFNEIELNGFKAWKLNNGLTILENLRFFKEEESNDPIFSKKLADLAHIYVNEAFGSTHRAHASIVGIANILPHFSGFHLSKEIKILTRIIENPLRPLVFVLGGAKIETKLPLISRMHTIADYILVGGELAEQTKVLADENHRKIVGHKAELVVATLNKEKTDLTNESIKEFEEIIAKAAMVVWNGPLGFIEEGHINATTGVANAVTSSKAYKIVGGGDTVSFLNDHKLLEKFDFASSGGGAMLEFLSGIKLPGLEVLEK